MSWAAQLRRLTQCRLYSSHKNHKPRSLPRTRIKREAEGDLRLSEAQRDAFRLLKERGGPLMPGTFISFPMSQYPGNLSDKWQYQKARTTTWAIETASLLALKVSSMPSWTQRPRWKARQSAITPTGVALHREALEAFAAGDGETLRRICVGHHAEKLTASLDRRPRREGVRFTIDLPTWSLWYPRLMSHMVGRLEPTTMMEQAVVAVASRQRLSRYNLTTGVEIPGSLRLQNKVEYVVLSRIVDCVTYESKPWRLWGTVTPTTLEEYVKNKIALEQEVIHKAGWKKPS
ncbi:hypothetical protein XA68_13746 [Ophiocordyceps unilateralis]|uniref:Tim44-like domain-containing protein n=1 Tax=Ophiocordyceps unilateralis TaxID=268505 RepID=A0A2A9PBS8_OPHUN|nr:hypothetical protein XA68_13746 [Ophiocordyceps unilateralis]